MLPKPSYIINILEVTQLNPYLDQGIHDLEVVTKLEGFVCIKQCIL